MTAIFQRVGALVLTAMVCLLIAQPSDAVRALATKEQQLRALDTILDEIEIQNGLIEMKEREFGVTIEGLSAKYEELIETAQTLEEAMGLVPRVPREVLTPDQFRMLMVALAAEFRDGHFNISKIVNNAATIGIFTAAIGTRLYVTGFSEHFYVPGLTTEPLKVGDEVIEVDGVAVEQLARRFLLYQQTGTADRRLMDALESILTRYFAFSAHVEAGAPVHVKFRRGDRVIEGRFNWIHSRGLDFLRSLFPENYPSPSEAWAKDSKEYRFGLRGTVRSYFRAGILANGTKVIDVGRQINSQITEREEAKKKDKDKGGASGHVADPWEASVAVGEASDKPEVKNDTSKLKAVTRLQAFIIPHEGVNVGVIRIPSYSPGSMEAAINEYVWLAEVLNLMQETTSVLVVDQLSNTGGYVDLVVKILSLLSGGKTLETFAANARLNETFMNSQIYPTGVGKDRETDKMPNFAQIELSQQERDHVIRLYESGASWSGLLPFLTTAGTPHETYGRIPPSHRARYTHPTVWINDRRSGSGGDFAPSAAQGNAVTVVIGETSSGLGAPVYRSQSSLPGSEMSLRCPFAYCERADGRVLENVGAVAEVYRPVVIEDLNDGFKTYAQDILALAVRRSKGGTREDLQRLMHERLSQRQAITDEKVKAAIEDWRRQHFAQITTEAAVARDAGNPLTAAERERIVGVYRDAVSSLQTEPLSSLKPQQTRGIYWVLPSVLVKADYILSTIREPHAVVDRLRDLARLPHKFTGQPEAQALARDLAEVFEKIPADSRFLIECENHLVAQPEAN